MVKKVFKLAILVTSLMVVLVISFLSILVYGYDKTHETVQALENDTTSVYISEDSVYKLHHESLGDFGDLILDVSLDNKTEKYVIHIFRSHDGYCTISKLKQTESGWDYDHVYGTDAEGEISFKDEDTVKIKITQGPENKNITGLNTKQTIILHKTDECEE